jgi:hypothetical protein
MEQRSKKAHVLKLGGVRTNQGSVTLDKHINLQCSNVTDQSYGLTIQGYVYPDGHMEGTETATNMNNSSYRHVYYWKAY